MKPFNKTRLWVIAVLLAASLAQLPLNYAAASVNRLPLPSGTGAGGNPGILALPPVPIFPTLMVSAVNQTQYLHNANITAGNQTYKTINSTSPNGTLATMTATTTPIGVKVIQTTANNQSIFASGPVPAGNTWTLSGNWTYKIYARPSAASTGAGYLVARLYKIDTTGNFTWLYDSGWSSDVLGSVATYTLTTWNGTVPTTLLRAGERFGIEFLVRITTLQTGTVLLGFDNTTAPNSSVSVTYTEAVANATLNQGHYRVGNNRLLSAAGWKADTDTSAINIPRNKNFRVRFQVYNYGTTNKSWRPQLEWNVSAGAGFTAVTTTSGADPFFIAATDNFTNGEAIGTAYFGLGPGTGTAWNGTAYDTENPASANITLPAGNYTEIEFSLRANDNSTYNGTYYLRLTDGGTAFDFYDVTAAVVQIQLQPGATDPHNLYPSTTDKCAACHRPHSGRANYLRKTGTSEQALCLSCHDGTGAGTNINVEFNKRTPLNKVSMNLSLKEWTHSPYESAATSFNGTNRHVECEDCHKQHAQYPRTLNRGNNAVSPNNYTTFGIGVNNTAANTTPTYAFKAEADYEYEICFKCHGSWSYGTGFPQTPGGFWNSAGTNITANQTNTAIEFNTLNYAYHPVESKGKNQPPVWANPNWAAGNNTGLGLGNNFVSPITANSTLKCSDCHGSNNTTAPSGPHGSTLRWMVKPYTGNASVSSTAIFCYNCHAREVYGDTNDTAQTDNVTFKFRWSRFPHRWWLTANGNHPNNNYNRWGIWCRNCHAGDTLGGMHGTNRGVGTSGTQIMGKRFFNGAGLEGWTSNATNGELFTKDRIDDAVWIGDTARCPHTAGGDGQAVWSTNYRYAP